MEGIVLLGKLCIKRTFVGDAYVCETHSTAYIEVERFPLNKDFARENAEVQYIKFREKQSYYSLDQNKTDEAKRRFLS